MKTGAKQTRSFTLNNTKVMTMDQTAMDGSQTIRLLLSLLISIFLDGSESWTLNKDLEKRILAFENKCYRSGLLQVHYIHFTLTSNPNQDDDPSYD